ncbi:hypothetical protein RNZ50_16120 [Paracoccaceae bacterium Fryx2]|nr:hypothetical protein [Paracoccaceae bacterium Fryx2]
MSGMMVKLAGIVALLLLAGCESRPLVSDYNGASVKVQTDMFTAEPGESALAEARRICGATGKRAGYASTRALPDYNHEHLYLCL